MPAVSSSAQRSLRLLFSAGIADPVAFGANGAEAFTAAGTAAFGSIRAETFAVAFGAIGAEAISFFGGVVSADPGSLVAEGHGPTRWSPRSLR